MSGNKDLDRQRAAFAWECAEKGMSSVKEYANLTKSSPALIMNNGLMQTLAFYKQKSKKDQDAHGMLLRHLCEWLGQRMALGESSDFHQVMPKLYKGNSLEYRRYTEEALSFLKWLRHFASALAK